jgi:hypothetical protein
VRFTISLQARREVLKRLLKLNHPYHAKEKASEETNQRRAPDGSVRCTGQSWG